MSPGISSTNLDQRRNKINDRIAELAKRRRRWVETTKENDFEDSIKSLLTDLYPDTAHFIYELLQNAEDAGASEVWFILEDNNLTFEHNGKRLFAFEDVDNITSIGNSSKRDDLTMIGKFGIGFKAVYDYTCTPEIKSGPYHFRIVDMVIPEPIEDQDPSSIDDNKTSFLFPFDNPKKPPDKARNEIERGLHEMNDITLLFLKNIKRIQYILPDSTMGSMELTHRCDDPNHISIVIDRSTPSPSSHHFLHFDKDVAVMDEEGERKSCRIAVAFGMKEPTANSEWTITPLSPGQVCIYFPAIKETSKLRFHVHAPFASTVARDSVRECEENNQLRDHLADLIADSMMEIKRRGYLDVPFLAVLPNCSDNVSSFYRPIMEQLVETFKNQPLLPMKCGAHAPASGVYRASVRRLSDLIDDSDLAILLGIEDRPRWIANPPQRNQGADSFLRMLSITEWSERDLVDHLYERSDDFARWLMKKGQHPEWHQDLYAFLYDRSIARRPSYPCQIFLLRIILCTDGIYRTGMECYLPDPSGGDEFPRVDKQVYSSGKNEQQQEDALEFLKKAGVREVDEAVHVAKVLQERYASNTFPITDDTIKQDMERFISLVKEDSNQADLFKNFFVFEVEEERMGNASVVRCKPDQVFVDEPYEATELRAYHDSVDNRKYRRRKLSGRYLDLGVDRKKLVSFAGAVGVQRELKAKPQVIPESHPEYKYLHAAPGSYYTYTGGNVDYSVPEFSELLDPIDQSRARLIWMTMCKVDPTFLEAFLRKNKSSEPRYAASTLVYELSAASWVPQYTRDDGLTFVRPREASSDLLPPGFQFDQGYKWIEGVEFGKTADDRSDQARRDGFDSYDEKRKMVKVAELLRKRGVSVEDVLLRLERPAPVLSSVAGSQWSAEDYGPACDPGDVLRAICQWWERKKVEVRRDYRRLLYPDEFYPTRLKDDEPVDRCAWLTLFALAAFSTLGRTQDAQHRTFIERGLREGWWHELALSKPPEQVKPWLDRLQAWSGVDQVQEYQLWRRAFVDLYTIVRWLDEYVLVMKKLPYIVTERDGDTVSLQGVLQPNQSPLLRELGIEAAPIDRTLGIGINWMIREMLRNGTYAAEDEAVMAPYCWMPSRRVREKFLKSFPVAGISDHANSEDSRHIHRFIVEHIGRLNARFDGDFDLPLQAITRKEYAEALRRCFGGDTFGQ